MLFPSTRPAPPATIKAEISSVPCIQITNTDFHPSPRAKKKYWNAPNITPFWNRYHTVPTPSRNPAMKMINATLTLCQRDRHEHIQAVPSLYTPKGSPLAILSSVIST